MNVTPPSDALCTVLLGDKPLDFRVAGSGPAVVLVHGGQCSSDDWNCLLDALMPHYTVIMPDGLVNPFDGWMVWQLLDFLNIERAFLVGHSWGGTVTQDMYRLRSATVSAIVDVDASAAGPYILARKLPNGLFSEQAAALYEANKDRVAKLRPHHQGDYPSEATFTCRFRAYERHDMTLEQKAATRPTPKLIAELPHRDPPQMLAAEGRYIKCPCLKIVTGRGKTDQSNYGDEWKRENSFADDYEIICIKEAGHWPWLEDKEGFLKLFLPFVKQHANL